MVRVLVVDDSSLMRKMLTDVLSKDPAIKIIDYATNGQEAVQKNKELNPDVITMDIEMPIMNGKDAIKIIMKNNPVPIIAISKYTNKNSKDAIEAIEAGAVDFFLKPSIGEISKVSKELIEKVKAVAKAKIKKIKTKKLEKKKFTSSRKKIIAIVASTGGPQTLESLLTTFPKEIPVPILIVQHMPPGFTKTFADRLNTICQINVKEAKEGDVLEPGTALIAPGGFHMELVAEVEGMEGVIKLNNRDPPELGVRPNGNRLLKSVSKIFKENTIGLVLTGMGSDGKEGAKFVKENGGTILAEAQESCVIYGMPKEVINSGYVDEVLPLENIPVALIQLMDI